MGVMNCSRNDCTNILCDTYIHFVGYICNECQSEFKKYLQVKALNPTTEYEINKELVQFISTSKQISYSDDQISVESFFNKHK